MSVAAESRIDALLETARRQLGVDVAYFSELGAGGQQIRRVSGNSDAFGFGEGTLVPLEQTYCRRMIEGVAPGRVPDAGAEPRMRDLDGAGALGCYLGVPVRLSDGRVYGSLCCAGRDPRPAWDAKDEAYLRLLADSVGALIETTAAAEPSSADHGLRLSLWFTGVTRAPMSARESLSTLQPFLATPLLHHLRLLITELMTNCIRHAGVDAGSAMGLQIDLGHEQLRGVVSDPGPGFERPAVIAPHDDRPGGFGLVILDTVADRWGLERDELFRVWFEVCVRPTFD